MDQDRIVGRLTEFSQKNFAPLPQITSWPNEIDLGAWQMTPELLSLYGTSIFDSLDEAQKKRLAFYELINFFSLNIHGERFLLGGLAEHLYGPLHTDMYQYVHHFIDEENKHLHYFGTFCTKYARVYPDKKIVFPRKYAVGEREFLFFAKVFIFEELVDHYNVRMAADDRLPVIIRDINRMHHEDEVRHLAFGRIASRDLYERFAETWPATTRAQLSEYLTGYMLATAREYCNPEAYRDAGIANPYDVVDIAFENSRPVRTRALAKAVEFFRELGVLTGEPEL